MMILTEHLLVAALYTIALINISKFKLSKIEITIIVSVLTSIGIISFFVFPTNLIEVAALVANFFIIVTLAIVSYRHSRIIALSLFYAISSVAVILFSGNINVQIMRLLGVFPLLHPRHYTNYDVVVMLVSTLTLALLIFFASYFTGRLLNARLNSLDISMRKKFANYILGGAIITLILFSIHTFLRFVIDDYSILNTIYVLALMAYFVFLLTAMFTLTDKFQKEAELTHQKEMTDNLQTYTTNVEEMVAGMKKFKHDHKNLLLGFSEHLKNHDIANAQKYYEDYMECFIESTADVNSALNDLVRLNIPELKSLLMFKFLRAMQQGVDVYVEIVKPIENVAPDNVLDLCRISGVLVDNAIEASLDAEKPTVRFLAYIDGTMVTLVFSNTCAADSVPQLDKLFDDGFSTKGDGRGHGLHTIIEIINDNEIFSIGTGTKNEFFEQELNIMP